MCPGISRFSVSPFPPASLQNRHKNQTACIFGYGGQRSCAGSALPDFNLLFLRLFSEKTIDNPSRLCYIVVVINVAHCIIVHIGRASVVQIQTVPFGARLPIFRT